MSVIKHQSKVERRAPNLAGSGLPLPGGEGRGAGRLFNSQLSTLNPQLPDIEGERLNPQLSTLNSQLRASEAEHCHSQPSTLNPQPQTHSAFRAAFSLIEIMITVGLLSFIILGLLAMFNQVQRAFRSSMTQVDVLESGRAVTDMLARELEQVYPTQLPNTAGGLWATNFLAVVNPEFINPLLQILPGTSDLTGPNQGPYRTNIIQTIFFTTRNNQDWIGTGYFVYPDSLAGANGAGPGTLFRFSTNRSKASAVQLGNDFLNAMNFVLGSTGTNLPPGVSRIADGIVDFRITTYDPKGVPIVGMTYNGVNHLGFQTNYLHQSEVISNGFGYYALNDQMNYAYVSNAVPASLDLQIGFLEKHILDRFKSIGGGNPVTAQSQQAQRDYLFNHPAEVHIFRQRIPVRNLDFQAYQ
jgi:hypothetical protein